MTDEVNATDAAVKLAEEQGLDLTLVVGTGAEGRVTKPDVEAYLAVGRDADSLLVAATVEAAPESETPEVADPEEPAVDESLAIIAALPTLQALIAWPGDRVTYAAELHARARELLG